MPQSAALLTVAAVQGLYNERTPNIDVADRIGESMPKAVVKLMHKRLIPQIADADRELLDGLEKAGFVTTDGPEGSGFLFLALDKAGG